MRGIYRDGLSQTREQVQQDVLEALREGRAVTEAERRGLPRKLRRELMRLEEALRQPIGCLDDVRARERDIEAYGHALGVAGTFVEGALELAPKRRRRKVLRLMAMLLLVAPFGLVLSVRGVELAEQCDRTHIPSSPNFAALFSQRVRSCVQTDAAQCKRPCSEAGLCAVSEQGSCVAKQRQHCAQSDVCRLSGRCTPFRGRCIAATDEDCGASQACRDRGYCKIENAHRDVKADEPHGRCIASTYRDCVGSDVCTTERRCTAVNGRCEQRKATFCSYWNGCLSEGLCTESPHDSCIAATDDDCRSSDACRLEGRCRVRGGRCKALDDRGCAYSNLCFFEGRCFAGPEGKCVDIPNEP